MPEADITKRLRKALESEQRRQQTGALSELTDVAETDPKHAIDLIPLVATYLDDDSKSVRQNAAIVFGHVAEEYPTQVKPAVPQLVDAVESDDIPVGAMAALGQVAKSYPNVAEPLIGTFAESLDDGQKRVRNNALASLADLADEYPDELHQHSSRYIELLEDDEERIRYNATSVLASLAKHHPEAVAPAIPCFRDLLDVDHTWTRGNACWALGYLRADEALDDLEDVQQTDSDEWVRDAAEYAVGRIQE